MMYHLCTIFFPVFFRYLDELFMMDTRHSFDLLEQNSDDVYDMFYDSTGIGRM